MQSEEMFVILDMPAEFVDRQRHVLVAQSLNNSFMVFEIEAPTSFLHIDPKSLKEDLQQIVERNQGAPDHWRRAKSGGK